MSKYDLLERHLRRQRSPVYEMTFADIERVMRALLPARALNATWWSQTDSASATAIPGRAWRRAGYDAVLVAGRERVRFERR